MDDITLDPNLATVCGYTYEELIQTSADRLDGVDLEQVRLRYYGYNFLGDRIYNPYLSSRQR